jgi:hypothetical protein
MSFETPLPRDHASDAACRSHGDDADHRDHSRLQRDHRPLGLDAAVSWVIALFVEGFTAYGAATWPDILWPVHESAPTSGSAPGHNDAPPEPSPRP